MSYKMKDVFELPLVAQKCVFSSEPIGRRGGILGWEIKQEDGKHPISVCDNTDITAYHGIKHAKAICIAVNNFDSLTSDKEALVGLVKDIRDSVDNVPGCDIDVRYICDEIESTLKQVGK